jgi:transposase-like protein
VATKNTKKNPSREILRTRIQALSDRLLNARDASELHWDLFEMLDELCEALDALDLGSTPEAFKPALKAYRGSDPAEIPRIRRRAVFYLDAMAGNKGALKKVAEAMGILPGTLKQWRRQDRKRSGTKLQTKSSSDPTLLRSPMKAGAPAEEVLLKAAKSDGALYERLRTPPKRGT